MTTNIEKNIIEKINKLLALSKSPNKAEAELALKRAHDLLTKYNLSMDELEISEINEFDCLSGRTLKKWRELLVIAIAKLYYCQSITDTYLDGYYRTAFVGKEHNALIAKSMFGYLEKAILKESKKIHKNAKYKYRENFKLGMAMEIARRIYQIRNSQTNPDEKALIVTEDNLINQYLKDKNSQTEKFDLGKVKATAFAKGAQAGKKVSLNNQINNRQSPSGVLS